MAVKSSDLRIDTTMNASFPFRWSVRVMHTYNRRRTEFPIYYDSRRFHLTYRAAMRAQERSIDEAEKMVARLIGMGAE